MKAEKRIKQLEDLIPKLKGNKKILPQRIEALEWELRALKAEAYAKHSSWVGNEPKRFEIDFAGKLLAGIDINKNTPFVFGALDGFGNPIRLEDVNVKLLPEPLKQD